MPENDELDEDSFTMSTVIPVYKKKINGGALTLWIFAFLSLIGGVAMVIGQSPDKCHDTSCSIGQVTQLSFGVMGICVAGFLALVGFLVMTGSAKRKEASELKEEEILKEALTELNSNNAEHGILENKDKTGE